MSSVECLRQFVNERLTAAAQEIFSVFEKTISDYEEEINRQRRLLTIAWKPEVKLHKTGLYWNATAHGYGKWTIVTYKLRLIRRDFISGLMSVCSTNLPFSLQL